MVVINFAQNEEIYVDMGECESEYKSLFENQNGRCYFRMFDSHKIINRYDVGQSTQSQIMRTFNGLIYRKLS